MTATPSLKSELDAFRARFLERFPADKAAIMARADADLAAAFDRAATVDAGEQAPDFALPNHRGEPVRLADRLARGPLVLTFYRGGWCPYCNLELRAWQRHLGELRGLGGDLLAVSPQDPDHSLSTAQKNELAFDVLSDRGSAVARAYGVAFELPGYLRELYASLGHPLPESNGTDDWTLPVPATFVIAPGGTVALAHVDLNYRSRLEPADALAVVGRLACPRAA